MAGPDLERERQTCTDEDPEIRPRLVDYSTDSDSDSQNRYRKGSEFKTNQSRRDVALPVLSVDKSAIVLVLVINFLDALSGSISTPILPFYAKEFDASYSQVGQLFSGFALAQMVSMPFLSWCSDKYGRRVVMLWATIGSSIGAVWQGTAQSYGSLLASRLFSGIWSGVSSVCQVYTVDVIPPDLRAEYLSYLNGSSQASVLFGPSIGAGLSALGLNVPLLVQGAMNTVLFLVTYAQLPESPEWCRLISPCSPVTGHHGLRTPRVPQKTAGMGRRTTLIIVIAFGFFSFCGMLAQMSIVSMFGIYLGRWYGMGSLATGFTMTLGAIASVATNFWVSPRLVRRLGEDFSSVLGFALVTVGSLMVSMQPFLVSLVGFMVAYIGLAINSSAVSTGAANLTDSSSRATIMTGTKMLKSLGAVVGPTFCGYLANKDVRLPFYAAAAVSVLAMSVQFLCQPWYRRIIQESLDQRRTVGKSSALLEGHWVDEHGTAEEIWDLGLYVANLLTARHYRWVTYNKALKNFLSDSFPHVATESMEAHRRNYDYRRELARAKSSYTYEDLYEEFKKVWRENKELRARYEKYDVSLACKGRSVSQRRLEEQAVAVSRQQLGATFAGFGNV